MRLLIPESTRLPGEYTSALLTNTTKPIYLHCCFEQVLYAQQQSKRVTLAPHNNSFASLYLLQKKKRNKEKSELMVYENLPGIITV